MARVKGNIKISGTVNGMTYYSLNGEQYVKSPSNLNKKRVMKDKAFENSRKAMNEFGASSMAAKAFRESLLQVMQEYADNLSHGRLVKIIREIISKGIGETGKKKLEFSQYGKSVKDFMFKPKQHLDAVFKAPVEIEITENGAVLRIREFKKATFINAPKSATHFKIVLALGAVSDYAFDNKKKSYQVLYPAQNGKGNFTFSEPISLEQDIIPEMKLALDFISKGLEEGILVTCLGIQFYTFVSGWMYPLQERKVMNVLHVETRKK